MPTPFVAGALVVRREKRRRRKVNEVSISKRRPRRGFKFSDSKGEDARIGPAEATPVGKRKAGKPVKENTFVFRVRKDEEKDVSTKHAMDAVAVSAALRAKQEKEARAEMRRLVRQKKHEEMSREALNEEEMKRKKLSADQVLLYHMVQRQVKRELRKVRKEFLSSAARRDIMQLSEFSLQTMKQELISFMAEHPPGNFAIEIANPENSRICAAIKTCEQQMKSLEEEETLWIKIKASIEKDEASASSDATVSETRSPLCELKVTQSLDILQRSVLQQLGSTTEQLALLDASMVTVNRLIVEAEIKKAQLFNIYHDSAFKGYGNVAQPKESLRSLLELPSRGELP
ncbi:hypothetical protein CCR75_007680 [Bremia lactucae]|uniref:Uncharacterized protein n=1 Tax=Bremia lactucae TaxID=4779 RepID=A0A976IFH5_BRELC|nr:hypothetical protein CCR75_007680 [Bremia lactucae]